MLAPVCQPMALRDQERSMSTVAGGKIAQARSAEQQRLDEDALRQQHWKRWGPYLSERAWGTVREDYSADGTAWESFPHDHARSRAYRWNEDGLAGICDRHQYICLRPGALERPRSDSQRTNVRPDRERRQSRRGRQGILLLSRFDADAFLHEVSVQVSAGGVSLRAVGRGEPPSRPDRSRVRIDRHRRLR